MIHNSAAQSNLVGKLVKWSVMLLSLCMLVACGGPPKWVKQGSGVYNEEEKAIYGVGAVVGIRNEPLAWETAENRARAELAKTFETYTAYLMEDYAASTNAGDVTRVTEEQNIQRAVKTFTAVTLNGVRPIDRYKDEETNTYYVLTRLSFKEMTEALQQAHQLNAEVRDFVKRNAERVFERLEKEEAKRRAATTKTNE
ncbi:MAG: hypothetical protein D6690_17525 [Nitrospirae bacterium]|nr:MAG: hypothetical protein D6690_17525 [Nitrospirota bacterium]